MNIAEILKDCPSGTRLYSPIYGELSLESVQSFDERCYPIHCRIIKNGNVVSFTKDGRSYLLDAEPTLFPSKNQRDWSKFRVSDQVGEIEARGHTKTKKDKNNMTRTKYKRVSFDLELAKKITNKEVKGRIVTEDNLTARIVCFDMKFGVDKILAVLVDCGGEYEIGVRCNLDGTCRDDRKEDKFNLHIEVPTYYRDYSNFVPQRWQTCLVRDYSLDIWRVAVCSGKDAYGRPLFYSERNADGCCGWYHYLPLSKVTERLIGISKSYEELIKELDAESTATTKNEQQ